jgi:hypothetical protein
MPGSTMPSAPWKKPMPLDSSVSTSEAPSMAMAK